MRLRIANLGMLEFILKSEKKRLSGCYSLTGKGQNLKIRIPYLAIPRKPNEKRTVTY